MCALAERDKSHVPGQCGILKINSDGTRNITDILYIVIYRINTVLTLMSLCKKNILNATVMIMSLIKIQDMYNQYKKMDTPAFIHRLLMIKSCQMCY